MGFFNYPANDGITMRDGFSYEFENAAAVPEPDSVLLVAGGCAWLGARARRRRRQDLAGRVGIWRLPMC